MDVELKTRRPQPLPPDPRSQFRADKPPIGGWLPGIAFTATQVDVLNAISDQIIPPSGGFPAPSDVDVVSFFAKYIAPEGVQPKWFPFIAERDFREKLDNLGANFVALTAREKTDALRHIERTDPLYFSRLRDMVYYAYYSRPRVVDAINANLKAGHDLRYAPQPYGYSDSIDDWEDALFESIPGTYIKTEEVRRVELPDSLARLSSPQAHESGITR